MQYQERINISQQPQEVRHHQRLEDSYQRQQRSHQRQKTMSTCHVSLNIGTVILVSDQLLLLIKFLTCQN